MPTSIVVLIAGGVGLIFAVASAARRARKVRINRFDSRESLSIDAWSAAYFPHLPRDAVAECLIRIGRITGIDAGRLRPSDRFDVELKLPRGSFIAGEWDDVEDDLARNGRQVQRQTKVLTISDYVELMGTERSFPLGDRTDNVSN
jgi:hypothetical protein